MDWGLLGAGVVLVVAMYTAVVVALVVVGRHRDAAAVAQFVPDCAILFGRLAKDPRVGRRHKLLLFGVALYLASPIDLIPDFIPLAGQLDDVIIVAVALRAVLRGAGDGVLAEHWPGPASSLALVETLACARPA